MIVIRSTILVIAVAACTDDADRLSATGLYADITSGELADGVLPVEPKFPLWSDGASKQRWLYLPPGTQIDTSKMDRWTFPVGTRLWKEFARDGARLETRVLVKEPQGWTRVSYVWNHEQTDAFAAPEGANDVLGTAHDVPAADTCKDCHGGVADMVIGVSAIQLDHTLDDLAARGLISVAPAGSYAVPGNDLERAALGYLHGNCGHCHDPKASGPSALYLHLALSVGTLASITDTPTYKTAIGAASHVPMPLADTNARLLVVPGDPDASLLYVRVRRRTQGQMPPLATELVDEDAAELLARWIRALPPL